MGPLTVAVDALAVARLARLVTEDVILDWPRDAVIDWATVGLCDAALDRMDLAGRHHDQHDGETLRCRRPAGHGEIHDAQILGTPEVVTWRDTDPGALPATPAQKRHPKIAELVQCPWCVSIYVAAGVVLARRVMPRAWDPVARLLAFSQVAGVSASVT